MFLKLRKGWFALLPSMALAFSSLLSISIDQAKAADGSKLVFSWQQATVYQEVNVASLISSGSTLSATVSAAEVQDWKVSDDKLTVGIQLYGAGGGLIYSHDTGQMSLTSSTFVRVS